MIEYTLVIQDPHTHLLQVEVRLASAGDQVDLVLPSWTPGSYLLREFPRNVQDFEASDSAGLPLSWRKLDKNTWRIEAGAAAGTVTARYRVYANELSVRTSHVDASHAYINGASVFMYARGSTDEPIMLQIRPPAGWRVATSLRESEAETFTAGNYDELVDSPIEVGRHRTIVWDQEGIPHRYAVWGGEELDDERLIADTRPIVRACSEMFGGLPYDRYLFILHVVAGGRGGLEHKTSSSLQVPPESASGGEYESLLALVAHEFFHVWLGKRIRPEPLGPFDYTAENYTRNLWVVEGFTTYYTDRILLRAGLMSGSRYLERLGDAIARLQALPGRHHQTLEDSSFDAWIKFYRPDAHTPNSQISYYQKGALVALALDLEIRRASAGERSLDDVLHILWERYGQRDLGFPETREGGIQAVVEEVGGPPLAALLERYVTTTEEIDFDAHLDAAGLELAQKPTPPDPTAAAHVEETGAGATPPTRIEPPAVHERRLGLRLKEDPVGGPRVTVVLQGSTGYAAGVNAGDEVIAVDGRRANISELGRILASKDPRDALEMLVSRRGQVLPLTIEVADASALRAHLVSSPAATAAQRAIREGWLRSGRHPSPSS